ncbi:MAG: Vps62-related protein [Oligoflexia bacterium]|nr:Vps62-related protein [Oligoflexia bacterium]
MMAWAVFVTTLLLLLSPSASMGGEGNRGGGGLLARQLAVKFAPILHFHPMESEIGCYPDDPEQAYLAIKEEQFLEKADNCIQELEEARKRVKIFYTFGDGKESPYYKIKYWIWYDYNTYPAGYFGVGDHYADWEHIELFISKQSLQLKWVYLSAHGVPKAFGMNELHFGNKTHFNVYVAAGSHANYASADADPFCYPLWGMYFCEWLEEDSANPITLAIDDSMLYPMESANFAIENFDATWGPDGISTPLYRINDNAEIVKHLKLCENLSHEYTGYGECIEIDGEALQTRIKVPSSLTALVNHGVWRLCGDTCMEVSEGSYRAEDDDPFIFVERIR